MKAGETIVESQVLFVLCISDSPNKLFPKANGAKKDHRRATPKANCAKKITEELLQKRTVQKDHRRATPKANCAKKITEELLQKRTVQIYSEFLYNFRNIYSAFLYHFRISILNFRNNGF